MKIKVPLLRPFFNSDELKEIQKVLKSGWVAQGPKVKEFEEKAAKFLGIDHAIAVTNCTAALHLSLLAVNIKKGDEVLVSDYTYPATGHAVAYCGAKPVFVDIDLKTYNINPDSIEDKITKRTKAIIPVHTFGQPADMDLIMSIVEDRDLKVIEDAACAFGAKYKNRYAGTIGDFGCFSFHARKGITTGEGGMVVTNNKNLANKIRKLSVFGVTSAWEREKSKGIFIPDFNELGYNYKMSDITAAVGIGQLKKLNKIIKRKRELAKYLDDELEKFDLITPPYVKKGIFHIYQSYVALVNKQINRNKLIIELMKKGVQTNIGTYASHILPVYKSKDKCPNSLEIFNRALALPNYYMLKEKDIELVSSLLKRTLEEIK